MPKNITDEPQENIDNWIKGFAPTILAIDDIRKTMGKNFSLEHPFTEFASVRF